jgi:hypothetical protein
VHVTEELNPGRGEPRGGDGGKEFALREKPVNASRDGHASKTVTPSSRRRTP